MSGNKLPIPDITIIGSSSPSIKLVPMPKNICDNPVNEITPYLLYPLPLKKSTSKV